MADAPAQISLTIDGQAVSVPAGTSVWEASRRLGVDIPVLCHQPRLSPVGVCRLCVVDVGGRVLAASCVREAENGMQVDTCSEKVERQRTMLTRLLMSDHAAPCERERTTANCELEALARRYGVGESLGATHADGGTGGDPHTAGAPDSGTRPDTEAQPTTDSDGATRTDDNRNVTLSPSPDVLSTRSPVTALLPAGNGRPRDTSSPVIAIDHQACILCDRCVRACDDIQSNEVIGRTGKGYSARIGFDLDLPMGRSTCVSCGECAAACPTGALTDKPLTLPLRPASRTRAVDSVCPYCGVGCAVTYNVAENKVLHVDGRDSPVNEGRLCVKGRYGFDYTHHPQRLTVPLIRRDDAYPKGPLSADVRGETSGEKRDGKRRRRPGGIVDYAEVMPAFREATWDEALDVVASRLKSIRDTSGPSALAGFGSAKCSNEEAYLFQKLVRVAFGTNNVDHCTRLCHASSVAALLETIGSSAVTNTFADVRHADVAILTGSNAAANHPVAATFMKEAIKNGTRLLIIDPRRSDLVKFATQFCQLKPGTDVAFYNAVMHVLIKEGLTDASFIRERTENFDALRQLVENYPPEKVAGIVGVTATEIQQAARLIGQAKSVMVFWGMGISQHTHGTDNARCLISLMLMTGNVGRAGTGLHPLRGQNNVQGASDAGLIPMVYPDYQPVADPEVRRKFETAWNVELSPDPGLTVVEIMGGALDGSVRGMLMMGENPFLSDPNINKVRKALSTLEFLVVQDIFLTETAEFADVILPATSALEKTGTYTSTDRRVQVGRRALDPPGQARLDWQVLCDISTRMGYPMQYDSVEEVFDEFTALTTSYKGLTHDNLGLTGKLWPCPDPATSDGVQILFDTEFPSGRGKFVPAAFAEARELPDADYPLILTTGRVLEHWHTGSMTRRAKALDALEPEPFVEMHVDDAAALGIQEGDRVTVRSRRGAIHLKARLARRMNPGSIFVPFHFREAAANLLTIDALDPDAKIPEYKFCAVKVERLSSSASSTDGRT